MAGTALPPTAEALMRSRYTAFAVGDFDYLRRSWHSSTRPTELASDPAPTWLGLKILTTEAGGPEATEGRVEFVARYRLGGRAFRLHERSRFLREDGAWRYVDGVLDPD
ncbi:YchJ family protein [Halochromatium sp.]